MIYRFDYLSIDYLTTLITIDVVDDTAYSSASVVDADHRGRWTQIFGGKASEPDTSRPVENAIFTYPTCIWLPAGGDRIGIS